MEMEVFTMGRNITFGERDEKLIKKFRFWREQIEISGHV